MTKEELMLTQNELKEATTDLENTRTQLQKTETTLRRTRQDRDEQKHLVSHHVKTENMLHAQATQVHRWSFSCRFVLNHYLEGWKPFFEAVIDNV